MTRGPLPRFTSRSGLSTISASAMNRLVEVMENAERRLVEVERRTLLNGDVERPIYGVRRFVVVDPNGFPDTITVSEVKDGEVIGHAAKPYLLRRTPFHSKTRDGIDYNYSSNVKRTASKTVPGNPPTTTSETQVIVPKYVAGDVIYAVGHVFGKRDNHPVAQDSVEMVVTRWLDMNVDGRYWAKQA